MTYGCATGDHQGLKTVEYAHIWTSLLGGGGGDQRRYGGGRGSGAD
jgi:hypothetical protein